MKVRVSVGSGSGSGSASEAKEEPPQAEEASESSEGLPCGLRASRGVGVGGTRQDEEVAEPEMDVEPRARG